MTVRPVVIVRILLTALIAFSSIGIAAPRSASAQSLPEIPEITGKAFFSFDMDADVELYAFNADEELPMASTTKLMTALVFAQQFAGEDLTQQSATIEQDDLAGIAARARVFAQVRRIIVLGNNDGFSGQQMIQMLAQERSFKSVGMVKVVEGTLFERQAVKLAVVTVLQEPKHALLSQ